MDKPIQSIRFNNQITDEQLVEFFGEGNVVEVRRGSWMSDLDVYSDEAAETLTRRLDERFREWKRLKDERHVARGCEEVSSARGSDV